MIRTKIKGTGFKAASNPDCEPDFYSMPPVGNDCLEQEESGAESKNNNHYFSSCIPIVTPNEPRTLHPALVTSSIALIPLLPFEKNCRDKELLLQTNRTRNKTGKNLPLFLEPKHEISSDNYSGGEASYDTAGSSNGGNDYEVLSTRGKILFSEQYHKTSVQPSSATAAAADDVDAAATITKESPSIKTLFVVPSSPAVATITQTDHDQDSLSISPSIFDDTYTPEESRCLQNDSFAKATDPLAVFLEEIGDGFEDDINFGITFGNYFAAI
jgi:hypothetical protein